MTCCLFGAKPLLSIAHLRNKPQQNLNKNTTIFIQENYIENVVRKIFGHFFLPNVVFFTCPTHLCRIQILKKIPLLRHKLFADILSFNSVMPKYH